MDYHEQCDEEIEKCSKEINKLTDMLHRVLSSIDEYGGAVHSVDWFNLDIQAWWKAHKQQDNKK